LPWRRIRRLALLAAALGTGGWRAESAALQRAATVAWDASPDTNVTDYIVRYGTRSKVYSRSFRTGGRTTATVGGLRDGLGYFITVAAVNRLGLESEPSEEIQYADPCAARVVNLTVEDIKGATNGARLSFPVVAGQKYRIESSADLQTWAPEWVTPVTTGKSILEFTDPGAAAGRWRFYRTVMAGPFYESPNPLTLAPAASPNSGTRIGFNTELARAYELQSSDNGQVWSTAWSTMNAVQAGRVEHLDREAPPSRRYRLLVSAKDSGQSAPCNDAAEFAPVISDPPPQFTWMDVPTDAIALLVADPDTPLPQLQFSFISSDPALVPPDNVRLIGQGGRRTLVVTPGRGQAGKAVIDIVVTDGIRSAATAVEIEVLPFTPTVFPVKVSQTAGGSVSPVLDGRALRTGERFTVTATPDPGYVFAGWSGDLESSSRTITFTMRPRLALEAIFVANPFAAIKGTYAGLFREDDAPRPGRAGLFTASVTDRGKYSGKLRLGGRSHSFAGQLNPERKATNAIPRKGANRVTVELSFGGGDSDEVSGRVTDGIWQAPLLGFRSSFDAKTSPAPFAGGYTMIFQGQDDSNLGPEGHGFGIAKVDGSGRASFAGTLANGVRFAHKATLSKDGQWPFYGSLHGGLGIVHGWLRITNRNTNDISGALGWVKPALPKAKLHPAGFTNEVRILGSRYVRPATSTNRLMNLTRTDLVFSGGNLPAGLTNTITLDERNRIGNLSGGKLSMTLSASSGLFKGSVSDLAGKPATFSGALLQNRNGGAGFLAGTNRSARATFGF
jgi:hypothetical protein